MFKKRYVAAAACALAVVGTANAVQVSRDGTGDFLIAPAYFIGADMSTDFKVVNTSATQSVVAKVVFRDQVSSAEVLDFLIYLSPSDVWTGSVKCLEKDGAGVCLRSSVTSADDSMQLPSDSGFASETNPAIIYTDSREFNQTGRVALPNQGYVEVIMGSAYNVPNPQGNLAPGVKKEAILAAHQQAIAAGTFVAADATPNVLTGSVTANVPGLGGATLPMLALADYDNSQNVQISLVSGMDLPTQRTPVADVEEALWKNNIAVPYAVGAGQTTLATFTFPTKLTYNNRQDGQYPFGATTCINANVYDNMENAIGFVQNVSPLPLRSSCLNEFQWLLFGSFAQADVKTKDNTRDFKEGWSRISFRTPTAAVGQQLNPAQSSNVGRVGVPVIATYMIMDNSNAAAKKFTWAYAPSTR